MQTIEAVLFDYGMVLSAPPLERAWEAMKQVTGLEESTFHAAYWAPRHAYDRGTHTGAAYWQAVGEHAGLQLAAEQIEALLRLDNELWTELNLPMVAWAGRLQQAGVRTGILSNLGDAMAAGVLAKFDWIGRFDHCTWSHAVKLAKPEAAIYRLAAEGLKAAPEDVLFIDDREDNIAGAEAVGMVTVRYTTHDAFLQEMAARGMEHLLYTSVP